MPGRKGSSGSAILVTVTTHFFLPNFQITLFIVNLYPFGFGSTSSVGLNYLFPGLLVAQSYMQHKHNFPLAECGVSQSMSSG